MSRISIRVWDTRNHADATERKPLKKHTFQNFSTVMFVAIFVVLAVATYHIGSLEARLEALEYRHERLGEFVDWNATRRERVRPQPSVVEQAGPDGSVR
jgi:hypothetical protein